MIDRPTFKTFVQMYRDTYGGKNSMSAKTAQIWYDNLKHLDANQFGHAVQDLLGKEKFKFQWNRVIEKVDLLYPKENTLKDNEMKWKSEDATQSNEDKRRHLRKFMDAILVSIQRKEVTTEEWHLQYAQEMLKTWGESEFRKQRDKLWYEPNYREFSKIMSEVLK